VIIGCCQIEIHLPMSASLKDKRRVVAGLRDRIRRHNVAFAEVDHQEVWQRAGLAIVSVAAHRPQLEALFESIHREVSRDIPGEVLQFEVEYF
jgi:uncharacterized protein YlxP (DUF503 family)